MNKICIKKKLLILFKLNFNQNKTFTSAFFMFEFLKQKASICLMDVP